MAMSQSECRKSTWLGPREHVAINFPLVDLVVARRRMVVACVLVETLSP